MSLDRLQSKQGLFEISAEPSYTVAASLSSIASNQLPGGYAFAKQLLVLPGTANSTAGGGLVMNPLYGQTYAASSGTGAMITHNNHPIVFASLSAGGLHNLQPAGYHGQMLTVVNIAAQSGSLVTGAILSGQGSGSTTTAAIPTLTAAATYGSSAGASAIRCFVGLSNGGGSASNSTKVIWHAWGVNL